MNSKRIFVFALVLGLLAGGTTYWYLLKLKESWKETWKTVKVVVAAENIAPGEVIKESMVQEKEIPFSFVLPGTVSSKEELIGAITRQNLYAGEQVLWDRVVKDTEEASELAYHISPGLRAVTIAVDEISGVAGLAQPGDRVDVIAIVRTSESGDELGTGAVVLVQNVKILAVGQKRENQREEINSSLRSVTLEVSAEEALRLILAAEVGRLHLILRSVTDKERVSLPVQRATDLLP
ncbi:Flp pilus assembly protein CpaB [Calderihabitans maritimus]|uniref:SAF domain-containing protein n=1 Tax=Calderihabitans maritimus TaxID=1246530 RepID=A0A1Z5HTU6_9FIRM|nr:Flp pilus assembly protein CpaB [Calderihabitans maritimus]GAW92838.1 hypothetical protein KKC1_19870 [Calderihabitans maritimus]